MEIVLILVVIVLLFGTKKLPDFARSVGRSMRIFKSEVKEMKEENSSDQQPGQQQLPQQQLPQGYSTQQQPQQFQQPQQQAPESFWDKPENQPGYRQEN